VNIKDNTFTYTVPALTACHIVLEAAEPVVYGDLNNDSKVNAVDIMMLKRYILGIIDNINLTAADIYFDGVVNSSDYNIMKRYLLKAIEDIPYVPENQAPKAIFTFSPEDPVTDENVVFNASNSIDEDGTIAYYVWTDYYL